MKDQSSPLPTREFDRDQELKFSREVAIKYRERRKANSWKAVTENYLDELGEAEFMKNALTTVMREIGQDLKNKSLLDVGCGTGSLSIFFAKRGARVTAIDLSPELIDIAEQKAIISGTPEMSRAT